MPASYLRYLDSSSSRFIMLSTSSVYQ